MSAEPTAADRKAAREGCPECGGSGRRVFDLQPCRTCQVHGARLLAEQRERIALRVERKRWTNGHWKRVPKVLSDFIRAGDGGGA